MSGNPSSSSVPRIRISSLDDAAEQRRQLESDALELIGSIGDELDNRRWQVLAPARSYDAQFLLHDAASLRHTTRLLSEITFAVQNHQEMSCRILGRAHIEAFLFGVYLHFGGHDAMDRIAQDTKESNERTLNELKRWREELERDRKRAEEKLAKVRVQNDGIRKRNAANPDKPPVPVIEERDPPRVTNAKEEFGDLESALPGVVPKALPIANLIPILTRMARDQGFGTERFDPVYHVYRLISAVGPHPTLYVYAAYVDLDHPGSHFDRTRAWPEPGDSGNQTLFNAVYSTAFLAEYVISGNGGDNHVASELRRAYEPDAADPRGWTAGSPKT